MPILKLGGSQYSTDGKSDLQLPLNAKDKGLDISNIISDWVAVPETRPRGAPVEIAVDTQGRILIVDDRNSMIMRIGKLTDGVARGEN